MTYVSNRRLIKNALAYILGEVTYDTGGGAEPAFALVSTDPSLAFNQEPFCLILRAPSMDKKGAVGEQDHTVAFQIILVLELENHQRTRQQTQDYMDDLEELVLTALDEADWHDSLNGAPAPPNISTWILNTTKNEQYIGTNAPGRIYISCIDVEASYIVDL